MAPDDPDPAASLGGEASSPPAELQRAFWILVALANLGVLGVGLGLLLVGFEGRLRDGIVALGIGVGALVVTYWRYRAVRRNA